MECQYLVHENGEKYNLWLALQKLTKSLPSILISFYFQQVFIICTQPDCVKMEHLIGELQNLLCAQTIDYRLWIRSLIFFAGNHKKVYGITGGTLHYNAMKNWNTSPHTRLPLTLTTPSQPTITHHHLTITTVTVSGSIVLTTTLADYWLGVTSNYHQTVLWVCAASQRTTVHYCTHLPVSTTWVVSQGLHWAGEGGFKNVFPDKDI